MYTSRQLSEILLSNYFSNKELGQNFIIDDNVIDYISDLAELNSNRKERKNIRNWIRAWCFNPKIITIWT